MVSQFTKIPPASPIPLNGAGDWRLSLENTGTLFVEDDAYGELNFSGKSLSSMREFLQTDHYHRIIFQNSRARNASWVGGGAA